MQETPEMEKLIEGVPNLRFGPHWNRQSTAQACGLISLTFRLKDLLGVNLKMVELGSFGGESGAIFASSGIFQSIELVDLWQRPEVYKKCQRSVWRYSSFVKMHKSDVFEFAKKIPDSSLNFVYVDADHSYEHVSKTLPLWSRKLVPGGILGGHDYTEEFWPGVVRAVNEFREERKAGLEIFHDCSWLLTGTR